MHQCVMVINEWFAGPPYFMERNGTFGKHKTAMQVLSHLHKHQLDLKERYYILVPILLELEAHTRTRVPASRFHQAISSVRQFVEIRHCSEDLHVAVPCFPSVRSFPSIPFHETRRAQSSTSHALHCSQKRLMWTLLIRATIIVGNF